MREPGPYTIATDDSGHDYVIPIERMRHWNKWIDSGDWDMCPGYAERIDGNFKILDYET